MAQVTMPQISHADDDKLATVASLIATAYGGPAAGAATQKALSPTDKGMQSVGGPSKLDGAPMDSPVDRRMQMQQQNPQSVLDQGQAALAMQPESVQRDLGPVFEEAQRKARAQQGSIA